VAVLGGDDLVAAAAMDEQRDLIAHRAARQKDRVLLAEQLGDAGGERIHRGIFAAAFVAHLSGRHGGTHGGAGTCRGIANQIDADRRHGRS
jgi:hypothetical protein